MQVKIKQKRKELLNPEGGDAITLQKKIKSYTYKLDKAMQKNNEAVAYNKRLKEEINELRNERKMFDNIYNHLKEELDKKKIELQDVIKKTKSVKEKREEA
jgi:chromosome segregation ATPase